MSIDDILSYRLLNQRLVSSDLKKPADAVTHLVAMQAQEFAMAKWAIGLRVPGTKETDIDKAFNEGKILRTHLMRPTWHFVSPEDIRWLLALTAPRVHAVNAFMYRKTELDKPLLHRCNKILIKALEGGKHLTRTVLHAALEQKKIKADGLRLSYIMMNAELEAIICSGPRQGKQFTYALLEERVPAVKALKRDESLQLFTQRYFASRGPATLQDFTYWSGLTIKDGKAGIAALPSSFVHEKINGQEYIYEQRAGKMNKPGATFLMPDYEEYGMSYKDRDALVGKYNKTGKANTTPYDHWLVIDGRIEGKWEREVKGDKVMVKAIPFGNISKTKSVIVDKEVKKYLNFFGD